MRELKARLFTDGGSRGNPGLAAFGYILETLDGIVLKEKGQTIGVATNNVAEYCGLIAGLKTAVTHKVTELEVISDSELIIKQMRGEYQVNDSTLRQLNFEATHLSLKINDVRYKVVRRTENTRADRLVNEALDAMLKEWNN